jgi:GAF domain-containing protein
LQHTYGWLCLGDKLGGGKFSDEDERLLTILGAQVGRMYENTVLFGKARSDAAAMRLLHQITRAIGERQDLRSIFQVVTRTLEESMPVDFGCICLYEPSQQMLEVTSVGARSSVLALELAMPENARIPVASNGLSNCVAGHLHYERDIGAVEFPFARLLAAAGLRSLVAAPLLAEDKVFGILVAARRQPASFSSDDCEFLQHLSEHVALAAHHAQLYTILQQAYEDLRRSQQASLQQERLLALGQMASGVAHDINNAISPIALYTESLLESETALTPRARTYLGTSSTPSRASQRRWRVCANSTGRAKRSSHRAPSR